MTLNNNANLKRTLLLLFGIPLVTIGMRGLFGCNPSTEDLEKRISKVEKKIEDKEFGFKVEDVIIGLEQNPEYANRLLEASFDAAAKNNSYSNRARKQMFYFVSEKMRQNPELTSYLPAETRQYMKRKAINESATRVIENIREGTGEAYKILRGE